MPVNRKLRVFLSSRNSDPIKYRKVGATLSDVRSDLVALLEGTQLFDLPLFEVWTNEDAVESGELGARETCLRNVADADIVLVLYNGRSGWATHDGGVGICHEEFQQAILTGPQRVYVVELPKLSSEDGARERDQIFEADYTRQRKWHKAAATGELIIARVKAAIEHAVPDLAHRGATASSLGGEPIGETLAWNEMEHSERQKTMQQILQAFLTSEAGAKTVQGTFVIPFDGMGVACVPNAIPDSFNVGAARERVGQVFRNDDVLLPKGADGPLHIVACYRSVTESAARKLYGVEDAAYIPLSSGILIRDQKLKVQILLVAKCEDTVSTRGALQATFEWIERTNQAGVIAQCAKDRAVIVKAVRQVNEGS